MLTQAIIFTESIVTRTRRAAYPYKIAKAPFLPSFSQIFLFIVIVDKACSPVVIGIPIISIPHLSRLASP